MTSETTNKYENSIWILNNTCMLHNLRQPEKRATNNNPASHLKIQINKISKYQIIRWTSLQGNYVIEFLLIKHPSNTDNW